MLAFKALSFSFARVVEVGVAVLLVEAEVVQLTLFTFKALSLSLTRVVRVFMGWTLDRQEGRVVVVVVIPCLHSLLLPSFCRFQNPFTNLGIPIMFKSFEPNQTIPDD